MQLNQGGIRYKTFSGRNQVYNLIREGLGIQLNQGEIRYTT